MTETMTAKVQKPGTGGTGGGVVRGMTFCGIKGTCEGFSRFQQIGIRTFPKTYEVKESESFFLMLSVILN